MSFLSMVEGKLPPGFRFHPRDEELICDYLMKKLMGNNPDGGAYESPLMIEVDLNKCEPWDIPESACVGGKESYFFSQRDRKYATGLRTNRATVSGYWKATGKDRQISRKGTLVGMRKTLVFYQGRAPKGRKSDWVMHEFRVEGAFDQPKTSVIKVYTPSSVAETQEIICWLRSDDRVKQRKKVSLDLSHLEVVQLKKTINEDWVLCRVFYKHRGISAKISTENCYDDTGSSSLPQLIDSYITFNQTPSNFQVSEQVPCFSSFSQSHTQPSFSQHLAQMEPTIPTKNIATFGGIPDMDIFLNQFSCDKKVIKAVLNHLTKLEGSLKVEASPSLGEGSSESYLTEVGLPTMWNQY